MPDTIVLKVNGDTLELNAFVRKALIGVVEGFLTSLHDVPSPITSIELLVKKKSGAPKR
jgi:hypothetical protein